MKTVWQDLRYGARVLLKQPGFTLIAVIILAFGIGANSAIFSVVNAVLLRPLPYDNPERLLKVNRKFTQTAKLGEITSPLNFLDLRSRNHSFEYLGAYLSSVPFNLGGNAEPEPVTGAMISDTLLPVLGVQPMRGRNFLPEEDQKGGNKVVILSYGLWLRRFGADPNVLGQAITLGSQPYTIVGVMPQRFEFPTRDTAVWIPFGFVYEDGGRGNFFVEVVGRLKPGVTFEQAQSDMASIGASLAREYPDDNADTSVALVRLQEQMTDKVRPTLLLLLGAVGCVLLIACANIANLLLVRASTRQKEISIRSALGASGFRIVRQLLSESLLLSLAGGSLGVLVGYWGVQILIAISPEDLPRLSEIGIDGRVLGFTFMVSILTGLLFGLVPALQASRPNLNEALKEGGRSSRGGGSWLRSGLVVAEVAMSVVLLISAGLLMHSFWRVLTVNPGFTAQRILTFDIALPLVKYDRKKTGQFFQQALDRISALPGAQAVGATTILPFSNNNNSRYFTIEGRVGNSPQDFTIANHRLVSQHYFETLGVPLIKGRPLNAADFGSNSMPVVVINQAFARRFFPNQDALGQRFKMGETTDTPFPWMTIIGIVGDVKHTSLETEAKPEMYRPFLQISNFENGREMTFAVRTTQPPEALIPAIRREIQTLDHEQPIANASTMEGLLSKSVARRQFSLLLFGFFALTALVLSGVGIYGVLSYTVTQGTREIGIRMALGARQSDVLKLVVGRGLMLAIAGLGLGVTGALVLTRLMKSLLFGVTPTDTTTFVIVSLGVTVVSLLACYLPARRATKVDPLVALRYE